MGLTLVRESFGEVLTYNSPDQMLVVNRGVPDPADLADSQILVLLIMVNQQNNRAV